MVFHSGWCGASSATRSKANTNCVYMGCSTHVVPSWSKVAMRCPGGTKSGLAGSVLTFTKLRIACFAGPAFHDGSGSCACATAEAISVKQNNMEIEKNDRVFMVWFPCLKLSLFPRQALSSFFQPQVAERISDTRQPLHNRNVQTVYKSKQIPSSPATRDCDYRGRGLLCGVQDASNIRQLDFMGRPRTFQSCSLKSAA